MDEAQTPSSATTGFFQSFPTVGAQYSSPTSPHQSQVTNGDPVLPAILRLYLPEPIPANIDSHLHDFARTCLDPETLRLAVDAETNQPKLHSQTTFGTVNRTSALQTGEGWRGLKKIQTRNGLPALGYTTLPEEIKTMPTSDLAHPSTGASTVAYNRRIYQFAINHLWSPSSATVNCPAAMSDGAAILLGRHLRDADVDQPGRQQVLTEAYTRLLSFDPTEAWTSGQWMTERSGGSDVSGTETVATRLPEMEHSAVYEDGHGMPLGPWSIDGFKWFSSATDSDMAVLLARTDKDEISAFYAPMMRSVPKRGGGSENELNGVRISRLKDKLGTKSLPTAELELTGMRAWLIGERGKGVREISAILNSTRLWTAGGSVGAWSRALAVARAYAKVRKVKGGLLADNTLHCAWMAEETVKYHAAAHLFYLGVALQGVSEQGTEATRATRAMPYLPQSSAEAEILLRILTPVIKAQCSAAAVEGVRQCLESLGGVGYCENNEDGGVLNVARIYRDVMVNVIWEGTATVLAGDLVRALSGRDSKESWVVLDKFLTRLLSLLESKFCHERDMITAEWTTVRELVSSFDGAKLSRVSRRLMRHVSAVISTALLFFVASTSSDAVSSSIATRWLNHAFQRSTSLDDATLTDWPMNRNIFLAEDVHDGDLRAKI